MKNLLITMTFILTFSFCQSKEKTSKTLEKEPVFRLSEHYSKFKFHDLKEFDIDILRPNERRKRFMELDSVEVNQIIQGNENFRMGAYFYYSTFSDPTLIAILHEPDYLGANVKLLKYDKDGKLRSNIFLSGGGYGCFGDYSYSKGKLIGDTSFIITHVYINPIHNKENKYAGTRRDSLISRIKFGIDDKIKIDTLFNKRDTIF